MNYMSRFGDKNYKNQVIDFDNFKYVVFPVWIKQINRVLYYNIPIDWTIRDFVSNINKWIRKDLSITNPVIGIKINTLTGASFILLEETNNTITIEDHISQYIGNDFNVCLAE